MEAQELVSKNERLEKPDHEMIVKKRAALRYYSTEEALFVPSLLRHFSASGTGLYRSIQPIGPVSTFSTATPRKVTKQALDRPVELR
jgi:hypothetical protein